MLIRDVVPFYMRDLVCTCSDGHGTFVDRYIETPGSNSPVSKCKKCEKYMRWMQRICMSCDERFVLTFYHPGYVTMWPTCWTCTNDTSVDPWYDMSQRFPQSYIAENYHKGMYDNWPYSMRNIVEPRPEDLIKKEPVTELVLEELDLSFEDDVIF